MSSHDVWKLPTKPLQSSADTTLEFFHFDWYLFLKIGCRQCEVMGRVLKQTAKAMFSQFKETSGRQRSLLLESSARVKNRGGAAIHSL